MNQGIISKLMSVLEASLSKLSRYDEGSLIGSILSLTNVSGSGKDLGQGYVNFARNNMDQVRGKINDELWILNIFEQWYTAQINMLCNWLSERLDHSLHLYQCTCLSHIVKVNYSALLHNVILVVRLKVICTQPLSPFLFRCLIATTTGPFGETWGLTVTTRLPSCDLLLCTNPLSLLVPKAPVVRRRPSQTPPPLFFLWSSPFNFTTIGPL